jgi:hypothetical protein
MAFLGFYPPPGENAADFLLDVTAGMHVSLCKEGKQLHVGPVIMFFHQRRGQNAADFLLDVTAGMHVMHVSFRNDGSSYMWVQSPCYFTRREGRTQQTSC